MKTKRKQVEHKKDDVNKNVDLKEMIKYAIVQNEVLKTRIDFLKNNNRDITK